MKLKIHFFILALTVVACTKFDDAELTDRNSFIRFYSNTVNQSGIIAEPDNDGGYIIGGVIGTVPESDAIIIKTDSRGNKVWEKIIKNGTISAIKPIENGYLILGDRIELNPDEVEQVSEIVNYQARLILMDNQGTQLLEFIRRDSVYVNQASDDPDTLQVDFHGDALTFDNNGNLVILGSFEEPGKNQRAFVAAFNTSTLTPIWSKAYGLSDRDYENCKSLHVTSSANLVWASRTFKPIQNLSEQYVSISYVDPNSTFVNNSLLGENDSRNHIVSDLQKSIFGFGAIGTDAEQNGSSSNIFFARIDHSGNIINNSVRYYDGDAVIEKTERDISSSLSTEDRGLAITAVDDGFLLAGSFTSTPIKGNGGEDIILLRTNQYGDILWSRIIGGSGDETISSVRYTSDGGFLLCGTNTIKGLSSIMIVKIDKNGELIN